MWFMRVTRAMTEANSAAAKSLTTSVSPPCRKKLDARLAKASVLMK
jgi:hypothetical protein